MPNMRIQPGQQLVETLKAEDGANVFSAVHVLNDDQHHFHTLTEHWSDPTSDQIGRGGDRSSPKMVGAESGLAVAKFAWDVIKEGKAGAKTGVAVSSALSQADKDPLHYRDTRVGASPAYTWTLRDSPIASIEYVNIKLRVEGRYGARPAPGSKAPAGVYLPDV